MAARSGRHDPPSRDRRRHDRGEGRALRPRSAGPRGRGGTGPPTTRGRAGSSATPRRSWAGWSTPWRRCLSAPGEVARWGSTTRASPCSRGTPRPGAATPIVAWQDKRSSEVGCLAPRRRRRGRARTGMPLDPYFSAGKLASRDPQRRRAVRVAGRRGSAPSTPSSPTGSGAGSRPTRPPCRVPSSASGWGPGLCELFGVPAAWLPRSRTPRATWAFCATSRGARICR